MNRLIQGFGLFALFAVCHMPAYAQDAPAFFRFAPDHCDFEITFPEKPFESKNCLPGGDCYDLHRYTMVYDLQTTVDISVTCNPSSPENYNRYNEAVMKAALAGMVESRSLKQYETRFSQMENVRTAAISGTGTTGAQEKLYSGQLWIGQNSVFTIQAELVGGEHPDADRIFSEILASIKMKESLPQAKEKNEKETPSEDKEESSGAATPDQPAP